MSWICFWFLVKNVVPHNSFGWVLRISAFPHFCSKSNVHIVRFFFGRISNSTPLFLGNVKVSPHKWCSFGCTNTVGRFSVRAEAHSSLPLDPWRHSSATHYGNSNCVHQKWVFFVPDSITKSSTVDLLLIHTYIHTFIHSYIHTYIILYHIILYYSIILYYTIFY